MKMPTHKHGMVVPARARGFTLIELMIVVAVIAILAAIGYPSYTEYVRKGNRAEAKATLMEAAQFMERWFTTNNTYVIDYDTQFPASLKKSPKSGTVKYNISFTATPTDIAYTLQAVPTGAQTTDSCETLSLTSAGGKSATGTASGGCW